MIFLFHNFIDLYSYYYSHALLACQFYKLFGGEGAYLVSSMNIEASVTAENNVISSAVF